MNLICNYFLFVIVSPVSEQPLVCTWAITLSKLHHFLATTAGLACESLSKMRGEPHHERMHDSKVSIVLMDHGVHASSVTAQYRRAAKNLTIGLNKKESLREENRQIRNCTVPKPEAILCLHILVC